MLCGHSAGAVPASPRGGALAAPHPQHGGLRQGGGCVSGRRAGRQHPCTPGGCYDRLRAAHGKVLLLGVTHARNTFIHSVEEVLNVPNRLTDKPMQMTVVDEAGAQHTVYMRRHYNAQQPHISEDFVKLEQAYLDCGAARNTKFGDARCILCDAEGLFRVTRHVLAPNPEAFVTEPVIPPERWQGGIL
ncbi:MAG: AAC(3) family N-acetyltransferase [Faecalibacterium prausnitzii]